MRFIKMQRLFLVPVVLTTAVGSLAATSTPASAAGGSCLTQAANPKGNSISYAQAVYAAPAGIRLILARDPFAAGNSLNGRLSVFYSVGTTRCEVTVRAGTGQPGLSACETGGPMPIGEYTVNRVSRVSNSTVQSVAWDLHMNGYGANQARATGCAGTAALRTDLLIHSEMKVSPVNYGASYVPASTADNAGTWDNGTHDWWSLGCIKLEPYAVDLLNRITSTDATVYRSGTTVGLTVRSSPIATL
jgi:hypothetical protein